LTSASIRTLHISKVSGIAGSERHLLTLLPGLVRAGIEAAMLIYHPPGQPQDDFAGRLTANGVEVYRLPIVHDADALITLKSRTLIRRFQPDIVHTHLIHADLYGGLAAGLAGVPHRVSSRHNDNRFRGQQPFRAVNRLAMAGADRIIAISEHLRNFVIRVEGASPEKVVTIPYGIDPTEESLGDRHTLRTELGYAEEDVLIGFFGRLIYQKGVDTLIAAFASVSRSAPHTRLLIVGDGTLRQSLESQVISAGLKDRVNFTGWLPEGARLMSACDLVVVPSRWEGFGLVTLEAMLRRIPLIASRVSALPEIVVDGETGLLTPPDDVPGLTACLTSLIQDPERREKMGAAGRVRVYNKYGASAMIDATADLYHSLSKQRLL
jgi:glycosyltransferase involved in cell wall biosynthesis